MSQLTPPLNDLERAQLAILKVTNESSLAINEVKSSLWVGGNGEYMEISMKSTNLPLALDVLGINVNLNGSDIPAEPYSAFSIKSLRIDRNGTRIPIIPVRKLEEKLAGTKIDCGFAIPAEKYNTGKYIPILLTARYANIFGDEFQTNFVLFACSRH